MEEEVKLENQISEETKEKQKEPRKPKKQWYIVSTFNNKEDQVKASLEKRRIAYNLEDNIFRIIVAKKQEEILDETGKPTGKFKEHNYFNNYLFVEMIMSDDAWFVVRNTPNVSGFIGSSGRGTKPIPMKSEDIIPILKRIGQLEDEDSTVYEVGDHVRIVSGTFESTEGTISEVNVEEKTATVIITLFGRQTPTSCTFNEIEKIRENR